MEIQSQVQMFKLTFQYTVVIRRKTKKSDILVRVSQNLERTIIKNCQIVQRLTEL